MILCALCSCRGQGASGAPAEAADSNGTVAAGLPLPALPASLVTPAERAAYVLEHFWDALDFSNPALTADTASMEQNFSNFLSVFPLADASGREAGAEALVKKASAAGEGPLTLVAFLAEKYLWNPNSPMYSEEHYIPFLKAELAAAATDPAVRERYAWQLETAMKNRPGTRATDFRLVTRDGRRTTLSALCKNVGATILIFYDPACDNCREILSGLAADRLIAGLAAEGSLSVLAVYAEGDRGAWDSTKASLPEAWTVAMARDDIQDRELWVLRAMPTICLLSPADTVLLKDCMPEQLHAALAGNAAAGKGK